jgi:biotin synthase-related radical SAM superfamily protein
MIDKNLIQKWTYSHKEADGTKVYVTKKNLTNNDEIKNESFEFKENGEFIGVSTSNNNINKAIGKYIVEGIFIYINFPNHYMDKMLTIKSLDSSVLKIK